MLVERRLFGDRRATEGTPNGYAAERTRRAT
jgi:hypothetical protein